MALKLGINSSQAIGQALKRNPYAPSVPCHRVVKSDGRIGGYCGKAQGNIKKKIRMLEKEGIKMEDNRIDLGKYLHSFS